MCGIEVFWRTMDPDARARDAYLFGIILFALGAILGLLAVFDAAFSHVGGEWSALLPLFTLFLDGPFALVLLGIGFTLVQDRRRAILIILAILLLAMPVATYTARRVAGAAGQGHPSDGAPTHQTAPISPLIPRGLQ
jgi:hypothetical protein